ncbi:MAG: S8 family serine peptidase [Xenococcus sp. (in: cyanobacteria)]
MSNQNKDYYYAGGKKVKLNRLPDSFAVRYKEAVPQRAMERKLTEQPDFAEAEELKEMPRHRLVIVTLPPRQRLSDVGASLTSLEEDNDVEFITSVYREPESGLRLIATDEITVRFKSDTSQEAVAKLNEENRVEIAKKNRFVPNQYLLRVKNPQETLNLANKYQESDLTEFAAPNFVSEVKKNSLPNDELLIEQFIIGQGGGLVGEDVDAEEAWNFTQGSSDITIAIIDDGVDIEHPDLQANIWQNPNSGDPDVNGWNFYDDNNNPRPQQFAPPYDRLEGNDSHGTPCAGVTAAVGNNTEGVAGIAYRCKILPVKIFMADYMVPFDVLADAIRYAGIKADVLSNSW